MLSYIAIAVISFFQGYSFVPQFTYSYAALSYFFNIKSSKGHFLGKNFLLEVSSLVIPLFFLLLVYHLYFEYLFIPQHINKVWLALFVVGFAVFRFKQEIELRARLSSEPVYVDFGHLDKEGRVKLDSFWTLRDLERYLVRLEDGVLLNVYGPVKKGQTSEKMLFTSGTVQKGESKEEWVIRIDWDNELQKTRDDSTDLPKQSEAI